MSRSSFGWNFSTVARMSSKRVMIRILDDRSEAFQSHSNSRAAAEAAESDERWILPLEQGTDRLHRASRGLPGEQHTAFDSLRKSPPRMLLARTQQKSLLRLHLKRLVNTIED